MKIDLFVVVTIHIVIAGFVSATGLSTKSSSSVLISTGLKNLGNTCYLNSQLQCAFHIPAVREEVLTGHRPGKDQANPQEGDESSNEQQQQQSEPIALLALRQVFQEMIHTATFQTTSVAPVVFCQRLGIPVMEQQDSQEFWKLLLVAVESDSLSNLYQGAFQDYIKALDGSGRQKIRQERYYDLSLDVTSSSTVLESLKKSFGEPELLSTEEGNGWRPEKGAEKVDAHKGSALLVDGLPPILQLHLKRFNYDWQSDTMTKINSRLTFTETLDLSTLCGVQSNEKDKTIYDLQSIVIHVGEYDAGHYYAYVRPDIRSDVWYRFNDNHVEKVTFQEVQEDAYGGISEKVSSSTPSPKKQGPFARLRQFFQGNSQTFGWGGQSSNAYVIQYVQRSQIPRLYREGT